MVTPIMRSAAVAQLVGDSTTDPKIKGSNTAPTGTWARIHNFLFSL
jgi:hypothetical protein